MKHFKTISFIFVAVITIIFGLNLYYLICLYSSIRSSVSREVMTAMADADIDDMWERADRANKAAAAKKQAYQDAGMDITEQQHGGVSGVMDNDGNFVTTSTTKEGVSETTKMPLRRDRSYTNQMMNEMSQQMHEAMDPFVDFNLMIMDSILIERLADRYIKTDFVAVEIVDSHGKKLHSNVHVPQNPTEYDIFTLCFNPDSDLHYRAYMTPLTRHILSRMAGVIATVFLLMVSFALAFWYLLHTVSKLRTIEEMKDDFVSNMTHELKTPIAIAYSANDALLNYDIGNDPAKKETYLKIANKQLNRLSELVEKILSMSMERRKTMKIRQEKIRLRPLIEEIAAAHRMRGEKEIRIDVDADDVVSVISDKDHLSNILNNLIDNAIKYSGDCVTIKVRCTPNEISVSDNGIGIPQKAVPFIFNKFYRVPHGNLQDVRGYGIGLYYVKSILDKMGWTITVKSKEGKGSTFTINFNNDGQQDSFC
ncbi:MAG: HAMP domain-containing histidine kinase [Muribaculaceae bacterium]|nr:HAMP domain-containing histidine kinase [Muribaculaceae bacterium]